jgi:hypothetical protein
LVGLEIVPLVFKGGRFVEAPSKVERRTAAIVLIIPIDVQAKLAGMADLARLLSLPVKQRVVLLAGSQDKMRLIGDIEERERRDSTQPRSLVKQ